jgi:hypothetical protein
MIVSPNVLDSNFHASDSYCYVYVLLLLSMLCSVHTVFILPTGVLRLPWLSFFSRAFSSVVKQMPGYTSQRRGTVRTLPN